MKPSSNVGSRKAWRPAYLFSRSPHDKGGDRKLLSCSSRSPSPKTTPRRRLSEVEEASDACLCPECRPLALLSPVDPLCFDRPCFWALETPPAEVAARPRVWLGADGSLPTSPLSRLPLLYRDHILERECEWTTAPTAASASHGKMLLLAELLVVEAVVDASLLLESPVRVKRSWWLS